MTAPGLNTRAGRLRHEQLRFDIGGEMFVEGFLGHLIERCCFVDRRVVYYKSKAPNRLSVSETSVDAPPKR